MNKTVIYIGGELPDKEASALRIMSNAKALVEYGYHVILIGERKGLSEGIVLEENYSGIKAYLVPASQSAKDWMKELVSTSFFKRIIDDSDNVCAVIMYNPHAIVFERMHRFCKRRKIKLIADCTEWHTVVHLSGLKKAVKAFDISRRLYVSIKKADGVIAISSFFDKMYNEKCKTIIVPPLVDLHESKWQHCEYDHESTVHIVYAGRMGIGKDSLNSCIQAFEGMQDRDFVLDIVGVSQSEYITQFPADIPLIEKMNSKIVFHGMLPHEEALSFVKKADFSLLIREHNRKNDSGFPTKFVESISCGTPVIASDFSDVKKYIVENGLGIMVEDISRIGTGIEQALSLSCVDLINLKQNCRAFKEFDYHNYVERLGSFIENVL